MRFVRCRELSVGVRQSKKSRIPPPRAAVQNCCIIGKVSIDGILPLQRSTLLQRCDRAGADLAPRKSGTTEKSSSSSLFPAELRQEKGTFFVSRFAHHMRSRTKTNYDFLGERNEYHDEKCKQIYPTVFSGKPSADAVGNQELSG